MSQLRFSPSSINSHHSSIFPDHSSSMAEMARLHSSIHSPQRSANHGKLYISHSHSFSNSSNKTKFPDLRKTSYFYYPHSPSPLSSSSSSSFSAANYTEELWRACAGPLVSVPKVGERVWYFPQGHMEQVRAFFFKVSEASIC